MKKIFQLYVITNSDLTSYSADTLNSPLRKKYSIKAKLGTQKKAFKDFSFLMNMIIKFKLKKFIYNDPRIELAPIKPTYKKKMHESLYCEISSFAHH